MSLTLSGPLPALEFLDALSTATKWNIVASPGVMEVELNFWLNKMSPLQAMSVLKFHNIHYRYDAKADLLFIMNKDEYLQAEHGAITRHEFTLHHADLENIESGVLSLLSHKGRMMADPRSSTLIVFDTDENIKHIKQFITELDQERISKSYTLQYANGSLLFDSIEVLLSESGQLSYDPRSNTLIVLDRPEQQTLIGNTLSTLDLPINSRSWILDYADSELVAEDLLSVIPENMGTVTFNKDLHQVTVTAISQRLEDVDSLIQAWDHERKQVQIEAYLATVSSEIARTIGINWSFVEDVGNGTLTSTFGSDEITIPIDPDADFTPSGLVSNFINDDEDLSAMLNLLDAEGDATILAHPRITVQDGQEAIFENTTEVPYATTSVNNNIYNPNTTSSTKVEFIEVGTILRVLPRITQNNKILMDIRSEDSSFIIREIISNGEITTVPEKTQNVAETQVLSEDEQTIIIGGLRTTNFTDAKNKVPILGDLPIVGRAFRSTGKNHKQNELLIFITPTIINGRTQPEAQRLAHLDQQLADTLSDDQKTSWERGMDNYFDRDLFIAIGQQGDIILNETFVEIDQISTILQEEKHKGKTVIIRNHPRAPKKLLKELTKIVEESGHESVVDDKSIPFVPNITPED